MEIKSINPNLGQDQTTKELCCSSSTLQRYRHDIIVIPPYRIPSNSHKRRQKTLSGPKRPQLTANETNSITDSVEPVELKNKLNGRGIIEIDDEYLDEILQNKNL